MAAADSPPLPSDWRPLGREDVVFRRVGEDWVLFDPRSQRIHVLNLTAALVWSFCTGERDARTIVEEVRQAFGRPPADDGGVAEALLELRDAGLLVSP